MSWVWGVYLAGVAIGLWRVDGPPLVKVTLALLWPIGPAVFVVVVAGLLVAAAIAFPWVSLVAGAGILLYALLRSGLS